MTKKERTRARLQAVAIRLMSDHGYGATTVDQIAAAADVSTMTFFRHFPSKDLVILDDPYDPMIGAAIAAQPATLPALDRVCLGLLAAWAQLPEPDHDDSRERVRIIAKTPELRARVWERNAITRELIVDALTRTGVDRLSADVAAGACLGALEAALLDWGLSDDGTLGDRVAFALGILRSDSAVARV